MQTQSSRQTLWIDFCENQKVLKQSVPLFKTDGNQVQLHQHGKDRRLILKRSPEMENMVIAEANKLIKDFETHSHFYDGVIYMMFLHQDDQIVPLYIGKSEKFGKKGNLSANIKGISPTQSFFARWGYGYAYHMGDLSAWVCPEHQEKKKSPKYERWAKKIFKDFPSRQPTLREPVFFWMKAWSKTDIGIWREYGATPLSFLEYLLIGVAGALFPNDLLNEEGIGRGQ